MRTSDVVVVGLNRILYNELTAINQYFLHSRMIESWGYRKLAQKEYEESVDEMRHADLLMRRIFSLEGLPNLQEMGRLQIGESVQEALNCDLSMELEARKDLQAVIVDCENEQDFVSRDLCLEILKSEESHIDWLEVQLAVIEDIGEANYLQSQIDIDS